MPYKSQAQAGYFHTHQKELAKQGVDVAEWDRATRDKHLPKRVADGGTLSGVGRAEHAVQMAHRLARQRRDNGGDVEMSPAAGETVGADQPQQITQNFGPAGNPDQSLLDVSRAQRQGISNAIGNATSGQLGQAFKGLPTGPGGPKASPSAPNRNDELPRAAGGVDFMGAPGASAMGKMFEGPIRTKGAGRTDVNKHDVASGSYVIPADAVSITGDGNTEAGFGFWKTFFKPIDLKGGMKAESKPIKVHGGIQKPGINLTPPHIGSGQKKAEGGVDGGSGPVPIIDAGGEIVVPPRLIEAKFGNLDHGHETLDAIVKLLREQEVERLKTAPPPKK